MTDSIALANIEQILTTFNHFINIFDNKEWLKDISTEEIKFVFKLGLFIEQTIRHFQQENCLKNFVQILNNWLKNKYNKNINYNEDFYSKICDKLLLKFFKSKYIYEHNLDIAVRMYTSLFPKQRTQQVLQQLILQSASFDAILDFVAVIDSDIGDLKLLLIVDVWLNEMESNGRERIENFISNALSTFKVNDSLPLFINILLLNINNDVTDLILKNILKKMCDRSMLTSDFWSCLLQRIDRNQLGNMCQLYHEFLQKFCDFLIYFGCMCQLNENNWVLNPNCPFQSITYTDFYQTLSNLCDFNDEIKRYVIDQIIVCREFSDSLIWRNFLVID